MGLFSSTPASTSSTATTNSSNTYTPDPGSMAAWHDATGTASGLAQGVVNSPGYKGQMVADPTQLSTQYWNQAGLAGGLPQTGGTQDYLNQSAVDMNATQVSPATWQMPQFNASSFQPGALNLPQFGPTPTVSAGGGVSGLASSYLVNPQQVSAPSAVQADQVRAPGAINPITGLMQVTGPTLQQYQMGPYQSVNAPSLQNLSMQAAGNVAPQAQVTPQGQVSTQSWTDPGTAQRYMSPYTEQVVNAQLDTAKTQEQQQLAQQASQAAQAGAFGGSRQAVEDANISLGYQQLAANIAAQGLQGAYNQGAQQFNTEQGLSQQAQQFNVGQGMQAQQFNVGTGLQAQLANQQMQQQANLQNLSAGLQTQGLQAQTGLQSQLANQQAGLTVGGQNLAAQLQTQGLGAQLGMQGQLANQQVGLQAALANQQAQEFGAGQQLQAGLANQQANLQAGLANAGFQMQAGLANQAAGIQTGLAAQQMGLQGAEFNAGQGLQAGLANQAAAMQGLGMQYQGGLQGALQTQNLGLSGAEFGGQLGLGAAGQQAQLQQAQNAQNMQAIQQAGNLGLAAGNFGLQGYQAGLQGTQLLGQAAGNQQGQAQMVNDAGYQQWLSNQQMPMQAMSWYMQMLGMQPLPYSTQGTQTQTANTTYTPAGASGFGQGLQAGLGAVASMAPYFAAARKGGVVPHGLEIVKNPRFRDSRYRSRGTYKDGLGAFSKDKAA